MKKPPAKQSKKLKSNEDDKNTKVVIKESWAGPLPPPAVLEQFNNIVENGAERIFTAWEGETKHRHKQEERDLKWAIFEAILGKIFAFLFVFGSLSLSAFALYSGAIWLSAILGSGTIASIVWAFIKTNRLNKDEKKKK